MFARSDGAFDKEGLIHTESRFLGTNLLRYVSGRATRPLRSPRWLPTPARRRVRLSLVTMNAVSNDAIAAAQADPERDAPLIHLLLHTPDPATGRPLSRQAIAEELLAFLIAGHDTTATTLAFSLWRSVGIGRSGMARQPRSRRSAIGDSPLTTSPG